jgi:hypothetical protein
MVLVPSFGNLALMRRPKIEKKELLGRLKEVMQGHS